MGARLMTSRFTWPGSLAKWLDSAFLFLLSKKRKALNASHSIFCTKNSKLIYPWEQVSIRLVSLYLTWPGSLASSKMVQPIFDLALFKMQAVWFIAQKAQNWPMHWSKQALGWCHRTLLDLGVQPATKWFNLFFI